MKFCKDCKWHSVGYCHAPLEKPDMVTGITHNRHRNCDFEREAGEEYGYCGPSAKLFAQIEPEELRERERWNTITIISFFMLILIIIAIAIVMFLK